MIASWRDAQFNAVDFTFHSHHSNPGVIAAAPQDWTHTTLLPVFSTAALTLGVTTSTLGSWIESIGPRTAGMLGSALWSGALLTTAVGVHHHSLPML